MHPKLHVAVYLDDEDTKKLEQIKEKSGVSVSAQIRKLVKKFLEEKP